MDGAMDRPVASRALTKGRNARTLATSVAVLCVAVLITAAPSRGAATAAARYLDPSASLESRVEDLLRRMTLAEKIGQMDQIVVGRLRDRTNPADGNCTNTGGNTDPLQPACLDAVLIQGLTGSILAGGTDNPASNTGQGWAQWYNTIQRYAIEHSRLHIPVIFGVDAVHGFGHPFEAPLFPHSIGIGATWDPAAARDGGKVTADALRATGWTWNFAPVQDLHRDNRWGRTY
jgi:beta-glucosidase